MNKLLIFGFFIFFALSRAQDEIDELELLIDALKNGNNTKVGFLSGANYLSVKRILPARTKPVIVEHKEDLTKMVLNGSLIAALTSGMPDEAYHKSLHIFSSTIVTLHSILMAPDKSTDTPHGVNNSLSTVHLSMAINAAITRIQNAGIDNDLAVKNAPKEIVHSYTCKDDQQNQFPLPNRNEAQGQLRDILNSKTIKVLSMGPYNWGDNDGNYLVDPPVGFYPDYMNAILQQFKNLSGPDNITYGEIKLERVWTKDGSFPWYKLFDGSAHITEPYFILDTAHTGSGKPCQTDADCLDSDLTSGKEICRASKTCYMPPRARIFMLRSSCTVVGSDSKIFTKRFSSGQSNGNNQNSKTTSGGMIAALVIFSLLFIMASTFVGVLILKEKRGSPLFYKKF